MKQRAQPRAGRLAETEAPRGISNADLAELVALEAKRAEGTPRKAYARASRTPAERIANFVRLAELKAWAASKRAPLA